MISIGRKDSFLINIFIKNTRGFPGCASGKEPDCQWRGHKRPSLDPWIGKMPWRRACNPFQYSCLENPMDRGAWQAIQTPVTKSRTRLKQFSHKHASTSPRRNSKGSLKGKLYLQILSIYENLKYLEILYPKIVLFLFLEKGTKIHPVCLRTVIQYGRLNLGPSQKYLQFPPGKSDQTLLSLSQVIMKHLN